VLICPPNFEFMQQLTSSGRVQIELTAAKTTKLNSSPLFKVGEYMHICWKAGCALRRYARNSGRRVVHFNHPGRLMFVVPLMLLAHRLRMGVIFTVHDPIPHKEPDRWLEARLERFLMLAACRVADRLIVHTRDGQHQLMRVCHLPSSKFAVIPHGAFEIQSAPVPASSLPLPLKILVFGMLRENKGIHLAIEAVQLLNAREERVQLLIAGNVESGSEQLYWEECKRKIAVKPRGIVFREEFIAENEIPSIFANCHIALLPYTQFYSQSGVAVMALSNARPLLATRSGGITELVEASGGGLLLAEATASAVRDGIEEALRIGIPNLARMGMESWAYVREHYSWSALAAVTALVYEAASRNRDVRGLPLRSESTANSGETSPDSAGKAAGA
jgi:glycosyltransferase involved in cell wall biosynthesis